MKPLDGMTITVRVETPNNTYIKTCTPVDIKQALLDYYLEKFSKELWKDITYKESHDTQE